MRILVSGASGFIGQHLLPYLRAHEHYVVVKERSQPPDLDVLNSVDAVINLSGESVAERWTPEKKKRIYDSRVHTTRALADAIASPAVTTKPKVFLCASAVGFYGDRGSQVLEEDSAPGHGFLSKVCIDWQDALRPAADAGVRTASLRFGIVLSTTGGAFPRLLKLFKLGTAGRIGSGKQYVSWVAIDDAIEAIAFVLSSDELSGAINICSPEPETNAEFVNQLGERLQCRRTIPVPAAMAYFAFGTEMSNELLLSSIRAVPEKLSTAGFQFKYPTLSQALDHLLRRGG